MKCPICHAILRDSAIFCDTCGNKLKKDPQTTVAVQKIGYSPTTRQARTSPVGLLLSGGALLLLGLWVGASFFSAAPPLSPCQVSLASPPVNQPPKSEVALVKESPLSSPVVVATPVESVSVPSVKAPVILIKPSQPPEIKAKDELPVNPFKKKVHSGSDIVVDPFNDRAEASQPPKKNADKTLRPNFGTGVKDPFINPF
jgi:hypothetical protein